MNPWFDLKTCPLPPAGIKVFAHYFDNANQPLMIGAFYAPPFTIPTDRETGWFAIRPIGENETEADPQAYVPAGWYACNDEQEIHWHLDAEVTHWAHLLGSPFDDYPKHAGLVLDVHRFMAAVGNTTQEFNVRQTALYIGLQLEEMSEKMEAVLGKGDDGWFGLRAMSKAFKEGIYDPEVEKADRAEMLDADVDLAWVTIGSAFSQGADVLGAIGEVARANLDKIQPDGTVLKDANGKVKKPDGWRGPDITPFTLEAM